MERDFDEFVCSIGFEVSAFDPCLYIKVVDGHCVLVLVYVDDVLVTGISLDEIAHTRDDLKTRFEMTDSGKYTFVLGIKLVDGLEGSVTMCRCGKVTNQILGRGSVARPSLKQFCEIDFTTPATVCQRRPQAFRHA